MRGLRLIVFALSVGLFACGCGEDGTGADDYESTVETFTGQVVHNGEPVSFAEGEKAVLQLLYRPKAQRFGIPLAPDGTFTIGWMPVGKYTASLERSKTSPANGRRSSGGPYMIPGDFVIKEGKTEYTVELGKNWQP